MAAINELDAFCIDLPANTSPFSAPDERHLIAVVHDEFIGHHTVEQHVPAMSGWSIVGMICRERAPLTVGQELLVNSQPITPEGYLKRWRIRQENPVPLARLALDKGLRAVAVFQWHHLPAITSRKASWRNAAYATFGHLLAAHGFTADPAVSDIEAGRLCTFRIDLASQDGARAAWWADDFLCASSLQDHVVSRRVEFHRVAYDAQPVVFHTTHATPAVQAAVGAF